MLYNKGKSAWIIYQSYGTFASGSAKNKKSNYSRYPLIKRMIFALDIRGSLIRGELVDIIKNSIRMLHTTFFPR